jgi:hypothetical protein
MVFWISNHHAMLREAVDRKVFCRLILAIVGRSLETADSLKPFLQRLKLLAIAQIFHLKLFSETPKVAFSIYGRKEILISMSILNTLSPFQALWSNNENIIAMAQDHFESLWRKARQP